MSTSSPAARQRRRRAARAAAPVAGLLAAGLLVWQGSTAAFTASTDNADNAWATGNLTLENDGGSGGSSYAGSTTALFNETLIKPGSNGAHCITVRSTGDLPGALRMYRGALSGTNSANLAANLDVTVDALAVSGTDPAIPADCTGYGGGTAGAVYSGTLAAVPASYAASSDSATLAGGNEFVTYRIGWSMPSSVTDNSLQSSNVVADLVWEVQ